MGSSSHPTPDSYFMPSASTPLFNWLTKRAAGVLLHPTSFPGDFGIGTFGVQARQFIDFLSEAGFAYWQVCPLGPTSFGDSPYQCPSAFAGNPYLIDIPELCEAGLLKEDALGPLLFLPHERVDFGGIYKIKVPILRKAFDRFQQGKFEELPYGDFSAFKKKHAAWLEPYAFFQALKSHFNDESWMRWPTECLNHTRALHSRYAAELELKREAQKFYQYVFHGQWNALRKYAQKRGVQVIGDVPIFAALDSADVWTNPEIFQLDAKTHEPVAVAGCPPDYFSDDGQFWGNPLYDWNALARDGYSWWLDRLESSFELFDIVRIDHFRGFESYWSIPADSPTARPGQWTPGPGLKFFQAVKNRFPNARIIAEDLGDLTPAVMELREQTGLPGMGVLQFAFGGTADNLYLPHNHQRNQVLYPGTHDNDTTSGWYEKAEEAARDHVRRYLNVSGKEVPWDFIRAAFQSVCQLSIISLQDLMSLDSAARLNTPGSATGNWGWRYSQAQLDGLRAASTEYLRELGDCYGRLSKRPERSRITQTETSRRRGR